MSELRDDDEICPSMWTKPNDENTSIRPRPAFLCSFFGATQKKSPKKTTTKWMEIIAIILESEKSCSNRRAKTIREQEECGKMNLFFYDGFQLNIR